MELIFKFMDITKQFRTSAEGIPSGEHRMRNSEDLFRVMEEGGCNHSFLPTVNP
jgi:hypothetical protein